MRKLSVLLFLFLSSQIYSQENVIEEVRMEDTTDKDNIEVPFAIIENVPVYKGCDDSMTNIELKNCMSNSIAKHISKNFNTNISDELGLPDGRTRINVIFKIDKEGHVIDVRSRAAHPELEKEAIRVIKLIPQLDKPGYQKGKPVIVPYSLPITFNIENTKKDSEEEPKK